MNGLQNLFDWLRLSYDRFTQANANSAFDQSAHMFYWFYFIKQIKTQKIYCNDKDISVVELMEHIATQNIAYLRVEITIYFDAPCLVLCTRDGPQRRLFLPIQNWRYRAEKLEFSQH